MKRTSFVFPIILLGILAFLVSSCVVTTKAKIVYDDAIPVEQAAWINLYYVGTAVGYNGISVQWQTGPSDGIQIPAGDTTLEINVNGSDGYKLYKGDGMIFKYNFQPQKQYRLMVAQENDAYGLSVYTYNMDEKITFTDTDRKNHYTGFVPFLNSSKNNKTVLN